MKKVLICGDTSIASTGFATHKRALLQMLHNSPDFEVAEFAFSGNVAGKNQVPWRYYPCVAAEGDSDFEDFKRNPNVNKNGGYRWNQTILHFKPDIVLSPLDPWLMGYMAYSPLKSHYHLCMSPPIDSEPLRTPYLNILSKADSMVATTEFGRRTMEDAGIKVNCVIPEGAKTEVFKPMDKVQIRQEMGLPDDAIVFGFVARNQPRKRIPELFESFRIFLDMAPPELAEKCYLYLHTSYLDVLPWNICQHLLKNNLQNKVFFSYICRDTRKVFGSLFCDHVRRSPFKEDAQAQFVDSHDGACSFEELARVYNCFDFYVQCANCEGFGIPIVEAAACDVPIIGINYSAMGEVVQDVDGIVVEPAALPYDNNVHSKRAIVDICAMASTFLNVASNPGAFAGAKPRERVLERFSWPVIDEQWEKFLSTLKVPSPKYMVPTAVGQPPANTDVPGFVLSLKHGLVSKYGPETLTQMEGLYHGFRYENQQRNLFGPDQMAQEARNLHMQQNQACAVLAGQYHLNEEAWMQ